MTNISRSATAPAQLKKIRIVKKIKVVLDKNVYIIKSNDDDKDGVVFECDTRKEWTNYLTSLPNPPKYIAVSTLVQNL